MLRLCLKRTKHVDSWFVLFSLYFFFVFGQYLPLMLKLWIKYSQYNDKVSVVVWMFACVCVLVIHDTLYRAEYICRCRACNRCLYFSFGFCLVRDPMHLYRFPLLFNTVITWCACSFDSFGFSFSCICVVVCMVECVLATPFQIQNEFL